MKKYFILALSLIINFLSAQDKNRAIDDYLNIILKEKNKEIIIIKEKINPNITLKIFKGNEYINSENSKIREGGVANSLYNEKKWRKMKNENELPNNTNTWVKNDLWTKDDFIHFNVSFYNIDEYYNRIESKNHSIFENITEVYSFSNPILYKKKYIVFTVLSTKTDSISFSHDFIVIMKLLNNKWVVIDKIYSESYY